MDPDNVIKARSYQLRIVDILTRQNGIVYLPTGSGKTYVAILALKRFTKDMDKSIQDGGKRALFICNTVELARQQAIVLKKLTNLKIGFYVGERGVDDWTRSNWEDELREHQVLVGTAQVMFDLFVQNFLSFGSVSVIIFDECHHGTGHHPYHEIMRLISIVPHGVTVPRVIGLTGVLVKGNEITQIVLKLKELETTFRGNIITISDSDDMKNVMLYSTKPREYIVQFPVQVTKFEVENHIRSRIKLYYETLDALNIGKQPIRFSKNLAKLRDPNKKSNIKASLNDFLYQLNDFGIYTASIAILSLIIEFEIKKRQAETMALINMYRTAISVCENIRHLLINKLRDMLDVESNSPELDNLTDTADTILNFSTPKVQTFLHYIKSTFAGKEFNDIYCLIFVERRYSAKCIYGMLLNYIESVPQLRNVLVPQFMVGGSGLNSGFDGVLERKWQKKAIQMFRDGECNMIVCSNVLEEGIDVQACNYVLILDDLKTFNMYVQSKGRARKKDSQYVIFCPEINFGKVTQQIQQYRNAHEEIANYLKQRVIERAEPNFEEVNSHFQDVITPFTNKHGAVLLASNALSLIHRYCQQLPVDAFGIILPWFELLKTQECLQMNKEYGNKRIVSITLPLTSPLRETIYSQPMNSSKWAKISAAFKTCVKLYEIGELNERLLPTTVKERVAAIADVHFEHWKKFGDDVTRKRRNNEQDQKLIYRSQCPDELYDALPRVGEPCYAYEIKLHPEFESDNYTEHMYNSLQTGGNYALLLRKKLPHLAEMPLFCSQGKLMVQVVEQPKQLTIESVGQLEQLLRFHMMLFRDLLRIWHPFFVIDRRSKEDSYLIVPLSTKNSEVIDMQLVQQFQRLSNPRSYSPAERREQTPPRPEDFEGKIVTQWYANYNHKRMLVTKVHTDISPMTMMDDKQLGKTYYEFTMSKYANHIVDVVHKNSFLIEVRELTNRINFYVNQRVKTSMINRARSKVMLIPELCFNFGFPGHLWVKLLFLPSILRRLTYMLHGETLRVRFNKYLKLSELPLNSTLYRPKPLQIDLSLRRNVDELGNAIADDEVEEKPKSLLDPLPTKIIETSLEKISITDLEKSWQDYMEPIDFARNLKSTYPLELDYYCNFINGQILNIGQIEGEEKELWTQNQFKMIDNIYGKKPQLPKTSEKLMPALMAANGKLPTEVHQLSVLQCSKSNEHITAAEQTEFMAALTTAGSVDVFDMERFELLGDSFLKLGATLYLANKYPNWNEGILTQVKSTLVSNRNLLYCLSNTDITQRICNSLFTPKYTWLPPSTSLPHNILKIWVDHPKLAAIVGPHNLRDLSLSEEEIIKTGQCTEENYNHFVDTCKANEHTHYAGTSCSNEVNNFVHQAHIQDKVVADTLEALLGVIVKNYGLHNGFRMLEYFGICKSDIGKPLTQLLDLELSSKRIRTDISTRDVDAFLMNYAHLEANLGYKFQDRAFLLQALTHPSFPTNRITGCYQELEFIGDAILDFLITAYIFENKSTMNPGQLTDLRSALVNNSTLACICVRHRLHFFILAENALLAESIKSFEEFQESRGHCVTNHVQILMEESDVQPPLIDSDDEMDQMAEDEPATPPIGDYNLSRNIDVPKALGDVLEALIAAIYLDCRNLQTTWEVIYKLFKPELIEFSRNVPINPIRQLNDHKTAKPVYSKPITDDKMTMVTCEFTCIDKTVKVFGFGNNGKQAKLASAKHALQKLAKCET